MLCPQHLAAARAAKDGVDVLIDSSCEVGTTRGKIAPGTYQSEGSVSDCYWERTGPNGKIIANNFITHASKVKVTVRKGDDSFTIEGCGTWRKAG
jgi:hypothetical protein